MKIFFIGTVGFSKKSLLKLIDLKAEIVGVATKSESQFNADHVDLSPICIKNNIPYKFIRDINSKENVVWIKELHPEVIFCFGWSNLLKKEILKLTPKGVIGFHPTRLPENRGRHPLIWAMVNGMSKSATTFFFMDEGADTGDILSQKEFEIDYEDQAKEVYKKVINNGLSQIQEFYFKLKNNTYQRIPQPIESNYWRKREKKDGKIDFRMSSFAIYNLVRALSTPYVGAHIEYEGKEVKIWQVKEVKDSRNYIEAGKVLKSSDKYILVKCYDGAIKIVAHEFEKLPIINQYL